MASWLGEDGEPWVGEWVEPGGGWVPNYVRINLRARYIHEMGGDNSSKPAKQLVGHRRDDRHDLL